MNLNKFFHTYRAGISLVEILIAMIVISCLILGVMWSEKQRWGNFANSRKLNEAIRAIEQKVESQRIYVLSTKQLPVNGTSTQIIHGITIKDSIGTAFDFTGTPLANVKSLTIWANWTGARSPLTISTFIAKDF